MILHTYLNYGGNCRQAFEFYAQHLGGKITMMMTHGEKPGVEVPPEWRNAVLHARMELGGTFLLGADVPPERFQPMRSAYLSLTVDSIFSPMADRSSCRWRKTSSPTGSRCSGTGSAHRGCW
jgi:PhnB protein